MLQSKKISCKVLFLTILCLLVLAQGSSWGANQSEKFPSKVIKIIVPTSPGGGQDTYARLLSNYLPKYLPHKTKIVVKNSPGAEHAIGINACLTAKPDGHTLVTVLLPGENLNHVLGMAKYDMNQLAMIGALTEIPNAFAISAKRPERSLKELQEASRSDMLKCASPGMSTPAGAGSVIASEILKINSKFVPHAGGAPSVLATIRGDCDYTVQGYPVMKSAVENEQLIPLWVYSKKRFGHLPDVPSIVELGYPELVFPLVMYFGAATSKKVPEDIRKILIEGYKKAVHDPGFAAGMEKAGSYAIYTSPEDMSDIINESNQMYLKYKSQLEKNRQ